MEACCDILGNSHQNDTRSTTKKTILYSVCVFLLCLSELLKIRDYQNSFGYKLSIMESIFLLLYNGAYMPYTSIVFLFFLGEMRDLRFSLAEKERQTFFGSVLLCFIYTFFASTVFLLFAIILSILAGFTGESMWTVLLLSSNLSIRSMIPECIIGMMNPISASLLAFLVIFLFWFTTALFMNMMYSIKKPYLGIMIYIVGIFWNSISFIEFTSAWLPTRLYTLKAILYQAQNGMELATIHSGILRLIFAVAVLLVINAIIAFALNRRDIKRCCKNKMQ